MFGPSIEMKGQRRLDRRLEEVAKAVGGGYCRLQMPLRLAPAVRGTGAGHRPGALEGGGVASPPFDASLPPPPLSRRTVHVLIASASIALRSAVQQGRRPYTRPGPSHATPSPVCCVGGLRCRRGSPRCAAGGVRLRYTHSGGAIPSMSSEQRQSAAPPPPEPAFSIDCAPTPAVHPSAGPGISPPLGPRCRHCLTWDIPPQTPSPCVSTTTISGAFPPLQTVRPLVQFRGASWFSPPPPPPRP